MICHMNNDELTLFFSRFLFILNEHFEAYIENNPCDKSQKFKLIAKRKKDASKWFLLCARESELLLMLL